MYRISQKKNGPGRVSSILTYFRVLTVFLLHEKLMPYTDIRVYTVNMWALGAKRNHQKASSAYVRCLIGIRLANISPNNMEIFSN